MGNYSMIILLVLMLGMFFMMNRSQKKQQQNRQNVLDSMKAGDNVVTIGGLHGVVHEMNPEDKTVTLDCEGIYLVFDRASIKNVQSGITTTAAPVETPSVEPKTEEPTKTIIEEKPEEK